MHTVETYLKGDKTLIAPIQICSVQTLCLQFFIYYTWVLVTMEEKKSYVKMIQALTRKIYFTYGIVNWESILFYTVIYEHTKCKYRENFFTMRIIIYLNVRHFFHIYKRKLWNLYNLVHFFTYLFCTFDKLIFSFKEKYLRKKLQSMIMLTIIFSKPNLMENWWKNGGPLEIIWIFHDFQTSFNLKLFTEVGLGLWCSTSLSTILRRSVLLVEETRVPGEDHWSHLYNFGM